jgi:transposase-like protein
MQLREGSFHGPRPACPEHPKQRVHRHGFYARFENCDSQQRLRIERFVCPRCGRTLSVLPKNRLPYIALNTTMVESEFDARASGTDPPSRSEKERGCLRRAFARFAARVTSLCALLGQMIGPIKPSVGELLEWATATGQPRRDSPVVGHKVQHLTSSRLPLPAARILSGRVPSADWIWSAEGPSHTTLLFY